ncbi:hypothetical protein SDC9_148417 [bioreactor metagenome]|uniref:Uncharacterized protein n=1 Tax=bioreactor metagenome TaxID=1076179 RepID=A0A645EH11_9ZZZZ
MRKIFDKGSTGHVHVDTGVDGQLCSLLLIFGNPMRHQLIYTGVVAYHKAGKVPFSAQYVGHQPPVCRCRHTVDFVEGCHHRAHPGIYCGLIGREINISEGVFRQFGRVVVPARFGGTVSCQVFSRGQQGV